MSLNQVSIGTRIAALAALLLLITLLVGGLGWMAMRNSAHHIEQAHAMSQEHAHAIDLARSAQVSFKIQVQEWKNLLLRSHQSEAHDKYRKAFEKEGAEVAARLTELETLYGQMGLDTAPVKASRESLAALQQSYLAALKGFDLADPSGSAQAVDKAVKGRDREPTAQLDKLVAAAREESGGLAGWEALELARLEAGIPRFGLDIDETNLAPEAGIESRAISYSKGCYIGQETIARIRTYGQVAKALRGLRLPDDLATLPLRGDKLILNDREVGYVTSSTRSEAARGVIALGYVRRECNAPGTALTLRTAAGEFPVTLVPLPFA